MCCILLLLIPIVLIWVVTVNYDFQNIYKIITKIVGKRDAIWFKEIFYLICLLILIIKYYWIKFFEYNKKKASRKLLYLYKIYNNES